MAGEDPSTAQNAAWLQEVADVLQMIADKNYVLKLKEAEFTAAKDGAVRSIHELVQSAQTQLQQKYDARLNSLDSSIRAITESVNIVRERYSKQLESANSQLEALSVENERLKMQLKHATKKAKVLEWKLANRPPTADGNAGDPTQQQAHGGGDGSPRDHHPSIQLPHLATAHQAYKEVLAAFAAMRQRCYTLQISQDRLPMRQLRALVRSLEGIARYVSGSHKTNTDAACYQQVVAIIWSIALHLHEQRQSVQNEEEADFAYCENTMKRIVPTLCKQPQLQFALAGGAGPTQLHTNEELETKLQLELMSTQYGHDAAVMARSALQLSKDLSNPTSRKTLLEIHGAELLVHQLQSIVRAVRQHISTATLHMVEDQEVLRDFLRQLAGPATVQLFLQTFRGELSEISSETVIASILLQRAVDIRNVRQMLRQQNFVEVAKHALYQLQAMRAEEADHHKRANDIDIISNNLQYATKSLAPQPAKTKSKDSASSTSSATPAVRESIASPSSSKRLGAENSMRASALEMSFDWPAVTQQAATAGCLRQAPGEHQSGYYVAIPGFPEQFGHRAPLHERLLASGETKTSLEAAEGEDEEDDEEANAADNETANVGWLHLQRRAERATDGGYTGLVYGAV